MLASFRRHRPTPRSSATLAAAALLAGLGCSSGSNEDSPGLRLATVAVDSDNDGIANDLFTRSFDADGLLATLTNFSGDGTAFESISYGAQDGRVVSADVDAGADGSTDVTVRYDYDASGRLSGAGFDVDGDGVADDALNVVREDDGIVVRLEEDFGDDGGVDYVRTLTYEEGPCDADDVVNVATPDIDVCP